MRRMKGKISSVFRGTQAELEQFVQYLLTTDTISRKLLSFLKQTPTMISDSSLEFFEMTLITPRDHNVELESFEATLFFVELGRALPMIEVQATVTNQSERKTTKYYKSRNCCEVTCTDVFAHCEEEASSKSSFLNQIFQLFTLDEDVLTEQLSACLGVEPQQVSVKRQVCYLDSRDIYQTMNQQQPKN